ncbi:MAG: SDR family NAD(P)-dependent oxidoreductase, partial [Planctomycetes bacterium]|nr:SDR family NAD(P)-dependent oxidoreductase [Planctomycetota bacterium]
EAPATFLLLGRTPCAEAEAPWLAGIEDESALKQTLLARAGGKLSPRALRAEYEHVRAEREIRATLARFVECGARAHYYAADITNAREVARALADARTAHGPIRAFIHGAGVLADQLIADKTDEAFQRVWATKVDGARNVLGALGASDLRALVFFSSSTARFGRTGQVDYAMANEALNKIAEDEAHKRPACRVLALNWGPWEGGMVTPALSEVFQREGVGLIPLAAGARQLVAEMRGAAAVEVVLLGSPGAASAGGAPTPPLAPARARADAAPAAAGTESALPVAFETEVDLASCPFLASHVLDGHAVLPMAMMIEWLAHGALHAHPGLEFFGFDALRVFKGVLLEGKERELLRVHAGHAERLGGEHHVAVELRGTAADGRDVLHARAAIVLADALPSAKAHQTPVLDAPFPRDVEEIYRERLFHGPELRGLLGVEGCSGEGIAGVSRSAPAPRAWLARPLRSRWLADPLVLDVSFQLMIVWSQEHLAAGSLPCFAGNYRQYQRSFPRGDTRIVIEVTRSSEHSAFANIEYLDRAGALVARMMDYECVVDASLATAFRLNQLVR